MGMRSGLPIALGYIAVSFTFGLAARKLGLTVFQSTLMSATNLTSAGQFAGIGLIAAGAAYWEVALTQLVINLRYSLMSCSLSQKLGEDVPVYQRLLMAIGISDEIFAVSISYPGKLSPYFTYGLMAMAIPGWTLGTLMGAALGGVLPARVLSAFGVALYGMFIAIVIPVAKGSKVVLGTVLMAVTASWLFDLLPMLQTISPGFRIIIITVAISAAAALLFPVKEAENGK